MKAGARGYRRTRNRSRRPRRRTRKQVPWAGWSKLAPHGAERTKMYEECGKKCFLGTRTPGDKKHPDFPICAKNTCKINKKGLYSAYIRARQWGKPSGSYKGKSRPRFKPAYYRRIANKAKTMLRRRGVKVGQ